jgi:hypothetical protein
MQSSYRYAHKTDIGTLLLREKDKGKYIFVFFYGKYRYQIRISPRMSNLCFQLIAWIFGLEKHRGRLEVCAIIQKRS